MFSKLKKNKISIKKKSVKKQNGKGFTLIELLTIIIILAIIVSLSLIIGTNIINKAKEKSYKVTVNNIERVASSYAIENYMKHEWLPSSSDNSKQYFCVSVGDLIDTGFLKNEVLDSHIGNDKLVEKGNYIYLERDIKTKAITKNLLVNYYDNEFGEYCSDYKTGVYIEFIEEPSGWAREKKLVINYKIYNLINNISDYKYKYVFSNANKSIDWVQFKKMLETEEINNIVTNGIVEASILSDGINYVKEYEIGKIDRNAPEIHLTLDGKSVDESKVIGKKYAKKRDVLISLVDNQSGLKKGSYTIKYEWSLTEKKCSELANSIVFNVDSDLHKTISKSVSISDKTGAGKLYVCGNDISDNVGNVRDNNTVENVDLYLDNIKPTIFLGDYSGDKIVHNEVVIPIVLKDDDSGIKKDSFEVDDIVVMIGGTQVTNGLTLSKVNDNNYNLIIKNSKNNGKISLKIGKDKVLDNALNGNVDVTLDPDVSFENSYVVSYDANGGIGAPASQTKTYGVDLTLSSTKPTRAGYEFTGWKATDGILYTSGGKYTKNEGTILSAQWKVLCTLPSFTYTGSFQLVKDDNTIIASGTNTRVVIPVNYQSYSGNWKIRFLTSGFLTFHELGNALNGIDAFLVGGGGGGGAWSWQHQSAHEDYVGGGGGGGGYTETVRRIAIIVENSYYLYIGQGGTQHNWGQNTTGFNITARGGSPGWYRSGGSGGSGGGAGGCDNEIGAGSGGSNGSSGRVNSPSESGCSCSAGSGRGLSTYEFGEYTGNLYAGGGGGGAGADDGVYTECCNKYGSYASGGSGGGGTGGSGRTVASSGQANTGGGGGGAGYDGTGGTGGSGIVIVRNAR